MAQLWALLAFKETKMKLEDLTRRLDKTVVPTPVNYEQVDVSISASSPVFASYIKALYEEMESEVGLSGGRMSFTQEELVKYVSTLIATRVDYVNGTSPLFHFKEKIRVPAFLSVALEQVGKVEVPEQGLSLKPVCLISKLELMDLGQVEQMSRKLAQLERLGFRFALGYSREKSGEVSFMTMELLEDWVMSDSMDQHPIMALFASFFSVTGLVKVLGASAFRVKYCELSRAEVLVQKFARGEA